jgi:hypothetical protein
MLSEIVIGFNAVLGGAAAIRARLHKKGHRPKADAPF